MKFFFKLKLIALSCNVTTANFNVLCTDPFVRESDPQLLLLFFDHGAVHTVNSIDKTLLAFVTIVS